MKNIAINAGFGGFSLSRKAFLRLREMKNKWALEEPDFGEMWSDESGPRDSHFEHFCSDIPRDDADLISVIKELKKKANGYSANLKIVSIPDNVDWKIDEYDGFEHVAEVHRTWG